MAWPLLPPGPLGLVRVGCSPRVAAADAGRGDSELAAGLAHRLLAGGTVRLCLPCAELLLLLLFPMLRPLLLPLLLSLLWLLVGLGVVAVRGLRLHLPVMVMLYRCHERGGQGHRHGRPLRPPRRGRF